MIDANMAEYDANSDSLSWIFAEKAPRKPKRCALE